MFLFFKSERILERFVSLEYFKFLKDLVWFQVVMFFFQLPSDVAKYVFGGILLDFATYF